MQQKATVELLAPAGSFEGMCAAFAAGADAVYMGGHRFGARAYADNPEPERFLEALDEAHLRGKQVYLTLNTLLKPLELQQDLYPFLAPMYERGLDAVLVQDFGVLSWIRQQFPKLPVHISTQMGLTGARSVQMLRDCGASRGVLARELSLQEIADIKRKVPDMEMECFVHGALCYCYSGQCLFSSLVGGRSGNRGRCAQPCRMPYQVLDEKKKPVKGQGDGYVLSPKELCTVHQLPELLEAGVDSLKIEGRMKKPEYAAGVVSLYRKYIDLYLEKGKAGYRVDPTDIQKLLDLFQRVGFTEGYLKQHNAKSMITLQKPIFRTENETWNRQIREQYIDKKTYQICNGNVTLLKHLPAIIELSAEVRGKTYTARVIGDVVEPAKNQPMTEETVLRQLRKSGNSDFTWSTLSLDMSSDIFVPMGKLNALRRDGMEALRKEIVKGFFREPVEKVSPDAADEIQNHLKRSDAPKDAVDKVKRSASFSAVVATLQQLDVVLRCNWIKRIYLEWFLVEQEGVKVISECHTKGKEVYLALAQMEREATAKHRKKQLMTWLETLLPSDLPEGILVRNPEGLALACQCQKDLSERFEKINIAADTSLYTFQDQARKMLQQLGVSEDTAPLELNEKELMQRGLRDSTLVVYGCAPMMVTANCIKNSTTGCQKGSQASDVWHLKDRKNHIFAVRTLCSACINLIYNCVPLSLHGQVKRLKDKASWLRLDFTWEDAKTVEQVTRLYRQAYEQGVSPQEACFDYTNGHFGRGVE